VFGGVRMALLSQEGSGIAKRIPRGVVPIGTTPALRATPPKEGIFMPRCGATFDE